MPWTQRDYPNSLKNLDEAVRNKAIEIANSLVDEQGYSDGKAIAIASARAKQWAARRGIEIDDDDDDDASDADDPHPAKALDIHVVPAGDAWRIRNDEAAGVADRTYSTQAEAISKARADARAANTDVVIHGADGKIRDRISLRKHDDKGPTYHVRTRGDEWIVVQEDVDHATRVFDHKSAAVEAGRQIARRHHGALVIHASDGSIQQEHNYFEEPEHR